MQRSTAVPATALDAPLVPRKMRPLYHPHRSCLLDVPNPRSDRDTFPRIHRHHHHGSSEKGPAKCLDTRLASVAPRTEAAGRAGLYPAFRAGAGGSGDAGIMVIAD